MESRRSNSIDNGNRRRNSENDNNNQSSNNNNNDEDEPILTATITFDVTVDPSGQVISTSEGQIIAESFQPVERSITFGTHHPSLQQLQEAATSADLGDGRDAIQADSLTSINSGVNQAKDITNLHDSLDEDSADESSSTSTESLIERSKKYMDQEAGIIILKRDNVAPQNFNINLDFDLKSEGNQASNIQSSVQKSTSTTEGPDGRSFNINLDFDIQKNRNISHIDDSSGDGAKAFNINLDFDINDSHLPVYQSGKKTGVGIDLIITSNKPLQDELGRLDERTVEEINREIRRLSQEVVETTKEDWKNLVSDDSIEGAGEPNLQEYLRRESSESRRREYIRSTSSDGKEETVVETQVEYEYISSAKESTSDSREPKRDPGRSTLEDDHARLDFIDRMVQKSLKKDSVSEKDSFYRQNIPKAEKFTLEDCIEAILGEGESRDAPRESVPVLRSFETVDFEALTRGFEEEEIKEGKLVMYITESQLLQLLRQRAIIVPDKKKVLSSIDKRKVSLIDEKVQEKHGRKSPVEQIELIVDKEERTSISTSQPESRTRSVVERKSSFVEKTTVIEEVIGSGTRSFVDGPSGSGQVDINAAYEEQVIHSGTRSTYEEQVDSGTSGTRSVHEDKSGYTKTSSYNVPPPEDGRAREEVALEELDRFKKTLISHYDRESQTIDWQKVDEIYSGSDQQERAKLIKDYVQDLIQNPSISQQLKRTADIFGPFIDRVFGKECKEILIKEKQYDKSLQILSDLIDYALEDARRKDVCPNPLIERSKVFEKFTATIFSNVPTVDRSTSRILNEEQINQGLQVLSEFYNRETTNRVGSGLDSSLGSGVGSGLGSGLGSSIVSSLGGSSAGGGGGAAAEKNYYQQTHTEKHEQYQIEYTPGRSQSQQSQLQASSSYIQSEYELQAQTKTSSVVVPPAGGGATSQFVYSKSNTEKFLEILGDFVEAIENKNPSDRLLTNEQTDRAFYTLRDYIDKQLGDICKPNQREIRRISSSLSVNKQYINDADLTLKILDDFIGNVIRKPQSPTSPKDHLVTIALIPNQQRRRAEEKHYVQSVSDEEALRLIEELIRRLRRMLENWGTPSRPGVLSKRVETNAAAGGSAGDKHKIIIKTIRRLPSKVTTNKSKSAGKQLYVKKRITYSYLDNYNPSTRVYEVLDPGAIDTKGATVIDIFNDKSGVNYSVKGFDSAIADSIGKPSVDQINQYLSVINTGVKNKDLVQVHPLLNTSTDIKNQQGPDKNKTYPSLIEPVIIDSSNQQKFSEDVAKHFGGLQIIDFPMYIQGLEFRESGQYVSSSGDAVITSKPVEKSNGAPKANGNRLVENVETYTRQVVNNVDNIQYVRVNNSSNLLAA